MTLPEGFPGGVGGDGSADERWGAFAAGGAARLGSAATDECGGGSVTRARAKDADRSVRRSTKPV